MSCLSNNLIEPHQVAQGFNNQMIKGNVTQNTPLTRAFFSTQNVEYIRSEIERRLRQHTGESNIKLVLTEEFLQTMVDFAFRNQQYAYNPEKGLPRMNEWVINHEGEIILLSMRKKKQYERWILNGDRMRVFPYGLGDRTLHAKGENPQTQSPYLLNHPWKSQYQKYLDEVLMVNCPTRPSQCNVNPPKYPNP